MTQNDVRFCSFCKLVKSLIFLCFQGKKNRGKSTERQNKWSDDLSNPNDPMKNKPLANHSSSEIEVAVRLPKVKSIGPFVDGEIGIKCYIFIKYILVLYLH